LKYISQEAAPLGQPFLCVSISTANAVPLSINSMV
jgi:hypothetical protein